MKDEYVPYALYNLKKRQIQNIKSEAVMYYRGELTKKQRYRLKILEAEVRKIGLANPEFLI